MITPEDVRGVFRTLRSAGYPTPAAWVPVAATTEAADAARAAAASAVDAWVAVLGDLDRDTLHLAVVAWMRAPESRYWPLPGQILALTPAAIGDTLPTRAHEMWGRLERLIASRSLEATAGAMAKPEPEHYFRPGSPDAVHEGAVRAGVAAAGGWLAICRAETTATDRDWMRRRFLDAFDAHTRGERAVAQLPPTALHELPDNVLAFVGGAEDPERAASRRRLTDRERQREAAGDREGR